MNQFNRCKPRIHPLISAWLLVFSASVVVILSRLRPVGAVFNTTLRPRLEMICATSDATAEGYRAAFGFARATTDWRVLVADPRVEALVTGSFPQRTTLMKVPTVSTLFDYIQRAMPWTAPKSLKPDEVYAILAYLLNLAEVVPADFELSDGNIREIQARMPNRNGMSTDHGMWPGAAQANGGIGNGGTPDVNNVACMKDCKKEVVVASALPDYAQDAHGNLAEQNRPVGQTRGKPTGAPAEAAAHSGGQGAGAQPGASAAATLALANAKGCMACHGVASKLVGPGYNEIAQKYQGRADVEPMLVAKVKAGGQGAWGAVPMPPQTHVKDEELAQLVKWILQGAKAQ